MRQSVLMQILVLRGAGPDFIIVACHRHVHSFHVCIGQSQRKQFFKLVIGDPLFFESHLCRFRAIFVILLILIILMVVDQINGTQLQEPQLFSLTRAPYKAMHCTLLASSDQFQRSLTQLFTLATNSFT